MPMHTDAHGALVTREATHTDDVSATGVEPGDARERLMAALGHELRGALQVALCWSRVLLEGESELEEPVRRGLRAIVRSTRLQQRLIDDVLDFTRMTDDGLRVELAECDLSRIAQDAASALELRAAQLGLDFRWEIREGVRIRGDAARVEQLVGNLLDNAFKFTPSGGAVVLALGLEGGAAVLSVRDSGRGISAELLPTVFDWRVQAEPGRRRSAGLGLGLAIAERISSLHGGDLRAESPGLGRGATFWWRVPTLAGG
jgi:signal transduction histidine kinase